MKKLFTFFVAAIAAMTLSATELTLDLNKAQEYAQSGSASVEFVEDVLKVDWTVDENWSVAGAAFALDNLAEVTKISFDYKADGSVVDLIACLENAEGDKLWDSEVGTLSLAVTEWTSVELVPSANLWSAQSEGPWGKLVFMANPASAMSGTFHLRNVKITYTEPEPADPNREYLSLDPDAWGWGYNSVSGTVEGGLQTTIISDLGAVSMGWDPVRNLSEWDKIVFEISHMDGCAGEWWKLKAYLRDESDTESKQMIGELGLDAVDNELNYLVIDLHQEVEGFDLTKARVLAVQCEPTGGIFTISSVYLLKENQTSVEHIAVSEKATKRIVNGMLLIEKNGVVYNVLGAVVK